MKKSILNVRLPEELESKLAKYSMEENLSKSSIVKEALAQYFTKKQVGSSPYAIGADLFGLEGSGNRDASVSYKKSLKQKLSEKHTH